VTAAQVQPAGQGQGQATGLAGNLLSFFDNFIRPGSAQKPVPDKAKESWERIKAFSRNSDGSIDYGRLSQVMGQQGALDDFYADRSANRALSSGKEAIPLYGQVQGINTQNTLTLEKGRTENRVFEDESAINNRLKFLQSAKDGELDQAQLLRGMGDKFADSNERIAMAQLGLNEKALEMSRPNGLERLLGVIIPSAGAVAGIASLFRG